MLGLQLAGLASANVYTWARQHLEPNEIQYRRVGMWTQKDNPGPGVGSAASIHFSGRFQRESTQRDGQVQLLLFHSSELSQIGMEHAPHDKPASFCCTSELKKAGHPGCDHVGRMIVRKDGPLLRVHTVAFDTNQSTASLSTHMGVSLSGVHYLLLSSCEPRTGPVVISGDATWVNPYGSLPGELYPFIPFFGMMIVAYAGLSAVWLALCYRHRSTLLPLQLYIGGVLALGILEAATWY